MHILGRRFWNEAAYSTLHMGISAMMRGLCYFLLGSPILAVVFSGLFRTAASVTYPSVGATAATAHSTLPTATCAWPIAQILDDLVPVVLAMTFTFVAHLQTHYMCLRSQPTASVGYLPIGRLRRGRYGTALLFVDFFGGLEVYSIWFVDFDLIDRIVGVSPYHPQARIGSALLNHEERAPPAVVQGVALGFQMARKKQNPFEMKT